MKQPEALRLADWCEMNSSGDYRPSAEAAAELRRLHAVNTELLEALKRRLEVDYAYTQLAATDMDSDTHERLLAEIDATENAAKEFARAAIAKATKE